MPGTSVRDTTIKTYRAKRDFAHTPEPAARARPNAGPALIFVVQKHRARRLHWDFRLEFAGVLWSWAVPKGPSLDPADKRLAVHVEDHPLDYAGFSGEIPAGNYGAGSVEIWDHGTWAPLGDAAADLARGEMKFTLHGARLRGGFVLVRLKPTPRDKAENWLLIKEHDSSERAGADAEALEAMPVPETPPDSAQHMPPGAVRAKLPASQKPQLAVTAEATPDGEEWISEVKFDGYRILAWKDADGVQLITRNGLNWTHRLPSLAHAISKLPPKSALFDGELVALQDDGHSSFPDLQAALSDKQDGRLFMYLFDLLHLDGWDLRPCRLADRKAALQELSDWRGMLRYSDHLQGDAARVRRQACAMGLEGIICKQADSSYRAGRSAAWRKVKCQGREEFVVLGWTPPQGRRTGLGSLHLGFYDEAGRLHYVGGVGTGFTEPELKTLTRQLAQLEAGPPAHLFLTGEKPDSSIHWVGPEMVAEVQYLGWSGAGRLRHAVYLGLREDKSAAEVVRKVPDEAAPREDRPPRARAKAIVVARPGARRAGVTLTHPDRELWPGITKQDLAAYWQSVADAALPGIAGRPLTLVRCPDGIEGAHFYQKHAMPGMPAAIRAGEQDGQPYLVLDDLAGLMAAAQMAALELHAWGARTDDSGRPDRLVFDLDPGEGVDWPAVIAGAKEVRKRLAALGLDSFCRTSGGKGLHVVVPLRPDGGWTQIRAWCQRFAQIMEAEQPEAYVSTVPKAKRRGRILVDWLRNGLGATAVASFSPRARPGAPVATPLAWREVTDRLDPAAFTLRTVPKRLSRQRRDPWEGIDALDQTLPQLPEAPARRRTVIRSNKDKP